MATRYSPSISTSGLILTLDAANNKSYPGSGTTWYDLSGNNNHMSIVGSPTYSSIQGWTFVSGSTSNYMIKNPITFPTTTISVEVWCKTTVVNSSIFSYASAGGDNDFLIFEPSNLTFYIANGAVSSGVSITDGNWKQVVRTSDRTSGSEILYINGINTYNGTLSPGTLVTSGGSLIIAQEQDTVGGGLDPNQAFGGNIAIVKMYNRILTATEVLQNYNATKSRFGL